MALREIITESISKFACIPDGKADEKRRFYYKNYEDNLYCTLGDAAFEAYNKGNGAEIQPIQKIVKGRLIQSPAKMASIVSSSAMTFNLLGNEPIAITSGTLIPHGIYDVHYEKQMYTIKRGSNPANLDAFLSNKHGRTAIFCEMKFLEWLNSPGMLKDSYLNQNYFFKPDQSAVGYPINAYSVFHDVIMKLTGKIIPDKKKNGHNLHRSIFTRYDAWQMLKHLLAIYNYTSFVTKTSVDSFSTLSSMAGNYDKIMLLNVVNEFPTEYIEDFKARDKYEKAMNQERNEAQLFSEIIRNSEIPHLFKNNCNAEIKIQYISAKQFADTIEMSNDKRNYLKRYFS